MNSILDTFRSDGLRQWLPLATLVILVILVGAFQPAFLDPSTLLQLASDTAVLFILATGVTFVIMLGGIDLSIQSMASLSSVVVALTLARFGYAAFALAFGLGILAGLLSGIAHVRLRIPSFIATLAMGGVLYSAALVISKERSITLGESERGYLGWITGTLFGVPNVVVIGLVVRPGEVHALMGENGAGKSTLIKVMAGVHAPDSGDIRVNGEKVRFASPREARAAGIATVYQELLLFPELSVAENIFLGHAPRTTMNALDWTKMRNEARRLLDDLDSHDLDVDARVGSLSVANRQRVEIAKALSQDARVLIMDEPTAALADADARRLMDVVRRLRDRGVAIVYVSHRMPEIFALATRVTVLRDGAYVGTHDIGDITEAELVSMMVGRPVDQLFPKVEAEIGAPVLELRQVGYRDEVENASFTLRAGEIVGIAGLIGSGRTELALTIFGITPATSGEILLDGKPIAITSPKQARDLGIAYVPEDRGLQGLIKSQTIRENLSLALLDRISTATIVNRARESSLARELIKRFGIRARGPEQRVKQLSGGNQQKVVLAKWVATEPRVLIMDEPTRGIDVGAKAEIHALMSRLAGQGLAVLMISSELPEVLGMSDRVLVMNNGRIVAEFDRAQATPDSVGAAMMQTQDLAEVA